MNGMGNLFTLAQGRSRRESSYDRSGGNHDWKDIEPGQTVTLAEIEGPGIFRHIWCTHWTSGSDGAREKQSLRKLILRVYWDDETEPSVEAPLGDFFGLPFGRAKNFQSAAFSMGPEGGKSMNCWWPMPFRKRARMTVESLCDGHTNFYYYVDYVALDSMPETEEIGYFHAQFRREMDTQGWAPKEIGWLDRKKANVPEEPAWLPEAWLTKNLDGKDNYVILEAQGRGHYVGCNMGVDIFEPQANAWYGEGDDMIFIDGEPFPPSLHGTGTEDYFCTAYCPTEEFTAPYFGLTLYSGDKDREGYKFAGQNAMYRLHIQDPVIFHQSIRVTIEHGHANKLSGDWCSTAYWYQVEPHAKMPPLPDVSGLLARE